MNKKICYLLTLIPLTLAPKAIPIPIEVKPIVVLVSQQEIQNYVDYQAAVQGISIARVNWIIAHESQWNPKQIGDDGNSRGLWQISSIYHPEVSDACAYNVECSTQWSLNHIKEGYINEWSSWRFRFKWYKETPPN